MGILGHKIEGGEWNNFNDEAATTTSLPKKPKTIEPCLNEQPSGGNSCGESARSARGGGLLRQQQQANNPGSFGPGVVFGGTRGAKGSGEFGGLTESNGAGLLGPICQGSGTFSQGTGIFGQCTGTFGSGAGTFPQHNGKFAQGTGPFGQDNGQGIGTFGQGTGAFGLGSSTFGQATATFSQGNGPFSQGASTFGHGSGTTNPSGGTFGLGTGTLGHINTFGRDTDGAVAGSGSYGRSLAVGSFDQSGFQAKQNRVGRFCHDQTHTTGTFGTKPGGRFRLGTDEGSVLVYPDDGGTRFLKPVIKTLKRRAFVGRGPSNCVPSASGISNNATIPRGDFFGQQAGSRGGGSFGKRTNAEGGIGGCQLAGVGLSGNEESGGVGVLTRQQDLELLVAQLHRELQQLQLLCNTTLNQNDNNFEAQSGRVFGQTDVDQGNSVAWFNTSPDKGIGSGCFGQECDHYDNEEAEDDEANEEEKQHEGVIGQSASGGGLLGQRHSTGGKGTGTGGLLGQSTGTGGLFGECTFGQSTNTGGCFGQSTGTGGLFGQSTGKGGFCGQSTNTGGSFGQSTGTGGLFGQSTGTAGLFGQRTGDTCFAHPAKAGRTPVMSGPISCGTRGVVVGVLHVHAPAARCLVLSGHGSGDAWVSPSQKNRDLGVFGEQVRKGAASGELGGRLPYSQGTGTFRRGTGTFGQGVERCGQGCRTFAEGTGTFGQATGLFGQGTVPLDQGTGTFGLGTRTFDQGISTFGQGAGKLRQGAGTFGQGAGTFGQGTSTFGQGIGTFGRGTFGQGAPIFGQSTGSISESPGVFGQGAGKFGQGTSTFGQDKLGSTLFGDIEPDSSSSGPGWIPFCVIPDSSLGSTSLGQRSSKLVQDATTSNKFGQESGTFGEASGALGLMQSGWSDHLQGQTKLVLNEGGVGPTSTKEVISDVPLVNNSDRRALFGDGFVFFDESIGTGRSSALDGSLVGPTRTHCRESMGGKRPVKTLPTGDNGIGFMSDQKSTTKKGWGAAHTTDNPAPAHPVFGGKQPRKTTHHWLTPSGDAPSATSLPSGLSEPKPKQPQTVQNPSGVNGIMSSTGVWVGGVQFGCTAQGSPEASVLVQDTNMLFGSGTGTGIGDIRLQKKPDDITVMVGQNKVVLDHSPRNAQFGTQGVIYQETKDKRPRTGVFTSVTMMPILGQEKSFEELRWEDYRAKSKPSMPRLFTSTRRFPSSPSGKEKSFEEMRWEDYAGKTSSTSVFFGAPPNRLQDQSFPSTITFGAPPKISSIENSSVDYNVPPSLDDDDGKEGES
eukprot:GHVN01001177.1.p1 GENE.GHVN01001177.1~~GHVN01001177.1.p1  ORF type:complete len:1281 (+),score=172.52 GHVN01001177.1:2828-6670(+)